MAVIIGGDELVVKSGPTVRILARDMSSGTSFEIPNGPGDVAAGDVAAGEQFLYVNKGDNKVSCLTYAGTEVASYEDQEKEETCIICPTLAPGGLLFCVLFDEDDNTLDEIVALDAQTLQPRYRFGLSLLSGACYLVVVGEELFVCDKGNDRLQVFSLAGEHHRSVTGEWKRPSSICVMQDRRYLVEDYESEAYGPYKDCQTRARRIFVLSLRGDTLQVYQIPIREGSRFSGSLVCFDGKLLVPYIDSSRECFDIVALLGAHGSLSTHACVQLTERAVNARPALG